MTKLALAIGGAVVILLVCAGAFIYPQVHRLMWPFLDRQIAAKSTITAKWLELTPDKPLVPDREIQEVVLYVEAPIRQSDHPWGCLLPDGSVVNPEVQIVAEDGQAYTMEDFSARVSPKIKEYFEIGFGDHDLPKNKRYITVRVRCERPISVTKIVWRCFNPWDVK